MCNNTISSGRTLTTAMKAWGTLVLIAGLTMAMPCRGNYIVQGTDQGLADNEVFALAVVGNTIYAGTQYGLSWLTKGSGRWQTKLQIANNPGELITCFAVDGATLWIGTDTGLARFDTKRHTWKPVTELPATIRESSVSSLLVDDERIWVGCWQKGLYCFTRQGDGSDAVVISLPEVAATAHGGPRPRSVYGLAAKGQQLFAGTERGVMILDRNRNRWSWLTNAQGLATQMVTALGIHGDNLWIGTSAGLARYNIRTKNLDVWTGSWYGHQEYGTTPTGRGLASAIGFISCILVYEDKIIYGNFRSGGSGYFDTTTETFGSLGIPGKAEICYAIAIQGQYLWAATPSVGRSPGLIRTEKLPWRVDSE